MCTAVFWIIPQLYLASLLLQLIGQLKSLDKKVEPQMKKLLEVVGNGLQNDNPSASESGREFEEQPKETRKRKQKRETSSGRKSIKLDATPKDLSVEATEKQAPVGEDPLEYYERMKAEKRARKKAREEGRDRQFEGQEEGEEEEGKRAITYQVQIHRKLFVFSYCAVTITVLVIDWSV